MEVRGPAGKQWVCWIEGWRSPAAALSGVVREAVRSARAGWREGQQRRREDSARVTQGGLEGARGSEGGGGGEGRVRVGDGCRLERKEDMVKNIAMMTRGSQSSAAHHGVLGSWPGGCGGGVVAGGGSGEHRNLRRRLAIAAWRALVWALRGRRPKPPTEGEPHRRRTGVPGQTVVTMREVRVVRAGASVRPSDSAW